MLCLNDTYDVFLQWKQEDFNEIERNRSFLLNISLTFMLITFPRLRSVIWSQGNLRIKMHHEYISLLVCFSEICCQDSMFVECNHRMNSKTGLSLSTFTDCSEFVKHYCCQMLCPSMLSSFRHFCWHESLDLEQSFLVWSTNDVTLWASCLLTKETGDLDIVEWLMLPATIHFHWVLSSFFCSNS